jgi:hypothetical protein
LWGIGFQLLEIKRDMSMLQKDNQTLSKYEINFNSFDDLNEEMEEMEDDEQRRLFLEDKLKVVKDLMDNMIELFVQKDGTN